MFEYPEVHMTQWVYGDTIISFSAESLAFEVLLPKQSYDMTSFPDTSYREKISFFNKTYMIDSLLYRNYSEYSGTYYFDDMAYIIDGKYYIVSFYNEFQLGTMVQPCFFVLKIIDGVALPLSLYMLTDIEDNSGRIENTICVYFDKDFLYLTGINLKLLRSFNPK